MCHVFVLTTFSRLSAIFYETDPLQEWRICAPGLGSCTRLLSPVVVQRSKGTVCHSMHFCLLFSELLYSVLKAIHQVYFQVNKVYFSEQIIHVVLEVCFFVTSSCYSDFKAIWWLESQLLEINKLNVKTLSSFLVCQVNEFLFFISITQLVD